MDRIKFYQVLEKVIIEREGGWKLHKVYGDLGSVTYGGVAFANLCRIAVEYLGEPMDVLAREFGDPRELQFWETCFAQLAKTEHPDGAPRTRLDEFKDHIREWYFKTYNPQVETMISSFPWNTTSAQHCLSMAINMSPKSITRITQNAFNYFRGKAVLKVDGLYGQHTRSVLIRATAEYDTAVCQFKTPNVDMLDTVFVRARECLVHAVYNHYTDIVANDYYDDDGDVDQAKFLAGWVNRVREGFLASLK